MAAYDVFISYRRDGGSAEARLLQSQLASRKIRAFLDVTELGRGYFDDALLKHIDETPNFVVILSPNCLNRSDDDEDWLRKEIGHALATNRNVVPLMMPGFHWPPKLPDDLKNLPRHNGMDYSHLYFDAMMQKLVSILDLSAAETDEKRQEQQRQEQAEKTRKERATLEEERQNLDRARQSADRLRAENAVKRQAVERIKSGDVLVTAGLSQPALVASWAAMLEALALLGASVSGINSQTSYTLGVLFLALAVWARLNPQQASKPGLVMSGLSVVGILVLVLRARFEMGGLFLVLIAAASTAAFWLMSRAQSPLGSEGGVAPPQPFGRRFAELVGVAGPRLDLPRLQLYVVARLAAALVASSALASSSSFLSFLPANRVNYVYVVWGAVALPLALVGAFRWLRSPLPALGASAVIAALVNPVFWQGRVALLLVAQELTGLALLSWAIAELESVNLAVWFGAAAAAFSSIALQSLWGSRIASLFQVSNFARAFLLAVVFSVVLAGGMTYLRKPKVPAAP